MKGFGKRLRTLTSCILLVCLLTIAVSAAVPTVNCPGGCTHQAAIGTTHYETLADAIGAAASGGTVTLLTDVTVTAPLTADKPMTLDLGGKTITGQNTEDEALLTAATDITVKNGTLTTGAGAVLMATDCTVTIDKTAVLAGGEDVVALILQSLEKEAAANISGQLSNKGGYPTVGVVSNGDESCTVQIDAFAAITATDFNAVEMYGAGKLEISGGTICAKENAIVLDVYDNKTMDAAITGGTFQAETGETIVVTTGSNASVPKDFVTGGSFNKVPTDFVPSYAKLQENSDGTYTVISAYTLTFLPGSGTGSMEPVTVPCGSAVQLPENAFTAPADMDFAGWEISGTVYAAGDTYTPESDAAVKALWKAHEHTGGKATCLQKAVCDTCGKAYGSLGNHALTYTGGYAATCTDAGMNAHSKCSTCGNLFVDGISISESSLSIPALGHRWETTPETPATCEEDGTKQYRKCATCSILQADGKTVTQDDLVIPTAGHTMETIEAVLATCTNAGIQAHEHCTTCGQQFLNGKPADAAALTTATASHVLSDWQNDEYYHWKTCVDCGEVFRQNIHHDGDNNGVCDDCGHVLPATEAAEKAEGFGFSPIFLIPIIAAVTLPVVTLSIKKRKE